MYDAWHFRLAVTANACIGTCRAPLFCHVRKNTMTSKSATKKPAVKAAAKQLVAVPRAAQKPTHASRAEIRRAVKAVLSMRQQANA
jgi:hypothetical protein